jgi:hypothetical protein
MHSEIANRFQSESFLPPPFNHHGATFRVPPHLRKQYLKETGRPPPEVLMSATNFSVEETSEMRHQANF